MKNFITSEMVMPGHPDKLCDKIADAILDDYLKHDKNAKVAVEVVASFQRMLIMGEITSNYEANVEVIARTVIKNIGYTKKEYGFTYDGIPIIIDIHNQSCDIALGVDESTNKDHEIGAGDQGMMFGYATDETEEMMPISYVFPRKLACNLETVRKQNILPYLRPDGKMQVTVEYEDNIPKRIDTIVLSTQHDSDIETFKLREDIKREVINPIIPKNWIDENTKILINPTGRFVLGGPVADTGLTGRKIIVDTYGGVALHGGGAFSGKDYTKVDRSAAYYARYVAKNIVAAGLARKCTVGVSYAIGISKPISILIDTHTTGVMKDEEILRIVKQVFDFRPSHIIESMNLKEITYQNLSNYGHFGRLELDLPFEKVDKKEELQSLKKDKNVI